ncbi:hypothetical protein, partial [Burkholderia sp. LMG 13014]
MVWFGLGFKRRDGSRADVDRKSCWPGGLAGSLLPDLFTVSGNFPGNPRHARVAWKIPGYLKKACQPGKTLIIPPAPAHSTGLAACG